MDGYLRNALVYSVLPVVITLAGATLAAFKPLPAGLISAARRFASGAALAVIAVELLPDFMRAHWMDGIAGFGLAVVAMIGMSWLFSRWEHAREKNDHRLPVLLIVAGASITIAGALICSGFVTGVREGKLLTLVATVVAPAVSLTLITALNKAGMRRGKLLLVAATLAGLTIAGATAGVKSLSRRITAKAGAR